MRGEVQIAQSGERESERGYTEERQMREKERTEKERRDINDSRRRKRGER